MIRVVHPGSPIPDPDADFYQSRIPDPGVKKGTGSRIRIRNTDTMKTTPNTGTWQSMRIFYF
jgi:hypothetical protein